MKLIAQVKLNPMKAQAQALKTTLVRANAACNAISKLAWKSQTFKQYNLHKLVYPKIREQFDLSAQIVVRAIAKVSDAYKLDTNGFRSFKPHGAFAFDDRILTWRIEKQFVTIWTVNGRQKIHYICGERQKQLLKSRQGESDLVYYKGDFFLLAVCEVLAPTAKEVENALGLDFEISSAILQQPETHTAKRTNRSVAVGGWTHIRTRTALEKHKELGIPSRLSDNCEPHSLSGNCQLA